MKNYEKQIERPSPQARRAPFCSQAPRPAPGCAAMRLRGNRSPPAGCATLRRLQTPPGAAPADARPPQRPEPRHLPPSPPRLSQARQSPPPASLSLKKPPCQAAWPRAAQGPRAVTRPQPQRCRRQVPAHSAGPGPGPGPGGRQPIAVIRPDSAHFIPVSLTRR